MLSSNVSPLNHPINNRGLKGQPEHPHLTPLTPPQSSRSSYAQLPSASTSIHPPRWISAGRQMASQGGPSMRLDRPTNVHPIHDQDEDEYGVDPEEEEYDEDEDEDDDDDDGEEDEDEEDLDEDEFETDGEPAGSQFDRLASLREPSPSGMLVFSTDDPEHFDVLRVDLAQETEAALVALSGPITSALTQYRTQFNQWELDLNPPPSVIHASTLIDQCLAKFVYTLEPLKWVVDDLYRFGCLLHKLNTFLHQRESTGDQSVESDTSLWNGLSQLADDSTSVQEALSDASTGINELCDWVDGLLTPALAEVKFPSAKDNARVSMILDVHSYLCESLVKACTILNIYLNCVKRIGCSIQRLQFLLVGAGPIGSGPQFPVRLAITWSSKWTHSLTPLINAMSVFHAISGCIQVHTAGRLSSTLSAEPTANDDQDSVAPYSQTHLPSSGDNPSFPTHCLSYA